MLVYYVGIVLVFSIGFALDVANATICIVIATAVPMCVAVI